MRSERKAKDVLKALKEQKKEIEKRIEQIRMGILTTRQIVLMGSDILGVDIEKLTGDCREREVFWARSIITNELRSRGYKYTEIGEAFGGKNHATIIHYQKRFDEEYDIYDDFKDKADEFNETLIKKELNYFEGVITVQPERKTFA